MIKFWDPTKSFDPINSVSDLGWNIFDHFYNIASFLVRVDDKFNQQIHILLVKPAYIIK